jgi:hypothetical protein
MELFNVVQVMEDGTEEYVRRNVSAEEAMKAVAHYTHNVATSLGLTKQVIITDQLDCTNLLWEKGKGFTFPPELTGRGR